MKKRNFSLTLLLLLFSLFLLKPAFSSSLDGALYKLEQDIKSGKSSAVIAEDIRCVLKVKKELPVVRVPELNYLTAKKIEEIPSTKLLFLMKILRILQPLKVYSLCVLLILAFFSVLFFFQQLKNFGYWKQIFVAVFLSLVVFSVWREEFLILIFLFGTFGVFLASFKKKNFTYFYFGMFALFVCCVTGEDFVQSLITSPAEEFTVKVGRDWFAPDYLVERAFDGFEERVQIEKLTNRVSWGNYTVVAKLKKFLEKVGDSEEKMVLLNDLGVVSFMKGDFGKAKEFFSKALKEKHNPIVEYNLFLTRSALLDTSVDMKHLADKIGNVPSIAKGIPITVHLYPERVSFVSVFFPYLVSLVLGIAFGAFVLRISPIDYGYFKGDILKVPGAVSFVNAELELFVVLPFFVTALNLLLGVLMCS